MSTATSHPPTVHHRPPRCLTESVTAATGQPTGQPTSDRPTPAHLTPGHPTPGHPTPGRFRSDHGQATTEYALILLAAALVGLLVVAWATAGGAAGRIGQLFDQVVDSVISRL